MFLKLIKMFSWVLTFALLFAILIYVYVGWDDIPFDSTAKSTAPGQYAKLTDGDVHYQWFEPPSQKANGKTVVMSHGYSVPSFQYNQIASMLAKVGYRVLIFDHFGHGFSERPNKAFNAAFFENEVLELLNGLDITQPIILIGQSMGGLIASNFTANYPKRIEKLVLLTPAGLRMVESKTSDVADLLGIPIVGEWLFRVFGRAGMLEKKERPCKICGEGKIDGDMYLQAKYEGYFESMRSILANFPWTHQDAIYEKLGLLNIPTFALFADKDDLVKLESAQLIKRLVPQAKVVIVEDSDHAVHVRRWENIGNRIIHWLTPND